MGNVNFVGLALVVLGIIGAVLAYLYPEVGNPMVTYGISGAIGLIGIVLIVKSLSAKK